MTHVSLEVATNLFVEARDYFSERKLYPPLDSEIRKLAVMMFGRATSATIDRIIADIFYVVSCDAERMEP